MIVNGKQLYDFIDGLLKPHGYIKKKDTWYLRTTECICFFSIGKSPFAGRYENVMGCFVKAINKGAGEFPVYYKKNLGYGLSEFVGDEEERRLFDLENDQFKNSERELLIKRVIEKYVIPFLDDVSTEGGIKRAIKKYKNLKYDIDVDLQEYLKIKVH
jgi:Domain of unknown function (DUF4304)